ncbi:MAG: histidine kinase [Rhodocyclales bacterium RIFCSPLOWO2_02_FULL_63_24]|nr:MAG: histidine kinase [Rhodocyclales bacterium GWA2_65_19]OHC68564.1 MAG: histidine kinase [Rhodocyclales bacterium RIFCSPLOWO2_02_FULL_63_24]
MQIEEQQALDRLVAGGIRIPPQPRVLIELRDAIASGDYSVRSISRIIGQDPGLVAMLFKASRSPVFSRGRKFDKLDQVLQVIGIKQTYTLVQAIALSTAIGNSTRKAFEVFWARSGEVAQLAAMIAEDHVSVCNVFPEQAYMAGIFHECGVPVLMMRFPDYCKKLHLDQFSCWPNLAEEDAKFKVDHCSIGYLVARHWGLPDFVCAAIRYHHEIPTEELGAAVSLVSIVQLAIQFHHRINDQLNPLWDKIGARVMEEIGLTSDDMEDYFDDVSARFNEANR